MSVPRSVAAHEIEKFRRLKEFWWTRNGALRSLHLFNPVRVQFIRETVKNFGKRVEVPQKSSSGRIALPGLTPEHKVLDVGCGGGILSESLARVGAAVTGIDACAESIGAARCRLASLAPTECAPDAWTNRLEYRDTSLFDIVDKGEQYDVVVASEVIEHVEDARDFLEALCRVTTPGGVLVVSTMDKSLVTAVTHIGIAEYLTGIVPRGTHDWAKFIPPGDLHPFTSKFGVQQVDLRYILTYPDIHQSLASRQMQLNFKLTRKLNTGHYFWAGAWTIIRGARCAERPVLCQPLLFLLLLWLFLFCSSSEIKKINSAIHYYSSVVSLYGRADVSKTSSTEVLLSLFLRLLYGIHHTQQGTSFFSCSFTVLVKLPCRAGLRTAMDGNLGEPVARLLRLVGGDLNEEDKELLRIVSVHDMSIIHTQLEYQQVSPAQLWAKLQKTLASRKTKLDERSEVLLRRQAELEEEQEHEEEAFKQKLAALAAEKKSALEDLDREERALRRDRDDFTEEEYEGKRKELEQHKAAAEEEVNNRRMLAEKAHKKACKANAAELEKVKQQLVDVKGPQQSQRVLWETYAEKLVSNSAAAASTSQPEPDEFAPLISKGSDRIHLPSFAPKCENCGAKFDTPPPDWFCPTCLSKKHRQRVWQLESDSIRCMVCLEAPIARFSRHHCRNCGRLVCSRCCSQRVVLSEIGYKGPEKVCDDCCNLVVIVSILFLLLLFFSCAFAFLPTIFNSFLKSDGKNHKQTSKIISYSIFKDAAPFLLPFPLGDILSLDIIYVFIYFASPLSISVVPNWNTRTYAYIDCWLALMVDSIAQSVSTAVTLLEEVRLPHVRLSVFAKTVIIGVPLAVLAYDTSSLWLPKTKAVPIISWFQRRWRSEPQLQVVDLQTLRNAIIFLAVVVLGMNHERSGVADMPSDYIEPRLNSAHAVRAMNAEIEKARDQAYEAANSVLGEEEMNVLSAQQQHDAALRRRFYKHEERQKRTETFALSNLLGGVGNSGVEGDGVRTVLWCRASPLGSLSHLVHGTPFLTEMSHSIITCTFLHHYFHMYIDNKCYPSFFLFLHISQRRRYPKVNILGCAEVKRCPPRIFYKEIGVSSVVTNSHQPDAVPVPRTPSPQASEAVPHRVSTAMLPDSRASLAHEANAGVLLELVMPVAVRLHDVEEGSKALGICLRLGRASNSVTRVVIVRLTDPSDPFFLYEMELSEEDYGLFKQQLELVVDFNGFPRFMVGMLQRIGEGALPYQLTFSAQGTAAVRGTLRIVEATSFRLVEHLSLTLLRQGDAGQKKYLAERFQFFEAAFLRCSAELKEERERMTQALTEARQQRDDISSKYRALQEDTRAAESERDQDHRTLIADMKHQYETQLKVQLEAHNNAVRCQQERATAAQQQLLEDLRHKDDLLHGVQLKYADLETRYTKLEADHRLLQTTSEVQKDELQSLRQLNTELKQLRIDAVESITSKDLALATLTEKVNAANGALTLKTQELDSLKEQHEQQSTCISLMRHQNEQLSSQVQTLEKSVAKAHYIISNQLQSISSTKDRYKIALEQIQTQELLLKEKQAAMDRKESELVAAQERAQQMMHKNGELHEQLKKTNEANDRLSQELQQMRTALIQVQKSTTTSHAFGRRFLTSPSVARHNLLAEVSLGSAAVPRRADVAPSRSPSHAAADAAGQPPTPNPARHLSPTQASESLGRTEPRKVTRRAEGSAADAAIRKLSAGVDPAVGGLAGKTFFDIGVGQVEPLDKRCEEDAMKRCSTPTIEHSRLKGSAALMDRN
eukprot:gene6136-4416_t